MKKIYYIIGCLLMCMLVGCGSKEAVADSKEDTEIIDTNETADAESEDTETFSTELDFSNTVTPVNNEEEKENPFAMYDGYYSYTDSNSFGCYIQIKDGSLMILTRGEKAEDIKSDIYIEDNKAYVELDGDLIQLGKKDMYTLEYTVVGSNMPSYLNYIDETYLDTALFDIERIVRNEAAEEERIKKELEEEKEMEEQYLKDLEEQEKQEKENKKNTSSKSSNNSGNSSSKFVPDPDGISYDEFGHEYYYGNRQYHEWDDDWDPNSMGKE